MKRRWLKRLTALAAALGALGALALLAAAADWYAARRADERRLDEALARLDADDPDWHVAGVVKAHNGAIPDDDAANVTKVTLSALGWRPPSWKSRQAAVNAKDLPDFDRDDDRLPHDEEFCSLYEVHLDSGQAHREALAARKFPTGGLPLHFGEPNPFGTQLPELQRVRECCALLSDYATVEAYFGRGDEALRAADASLHLAQASLATEPLLISQLVRNACCGTAVGSAQRTLAWAEPTAGLAELQAAFAHAAAGDGIGVGLRGERASVMRVYDNVRSGALPLDALTDLSGRQTSSWADRLEQNYHARNVVRDQAESLQLLNAFLEAAKLEGPARRAACDVLRGRVSRNANRLLPAVNKCVEADDRCKARLLCASVGLACERHRRQFGHFPPTLADIPPAILPAIPTDPFSGEPLGYVLLDDGAWVFSVGAEDSVRLGPAGRNDFRLWNPDARRRPPTPRFDPDAEELPDTPPGDTP